MHFKSPPFFFPFSLLLGYPLFPYSLIVLSLSRFFTLTLTLTLSPFFSLSLTHHHWRGLFPPFAATLSSVHTTHHGLAQFALLLRRSSAPFCHDSAFLLATVLLIFLRRGSAPHPSMIMLVFVVVPFMLWAASSSVVALPPW